MLSPITPASPTIDPTQALKEQNQSLKQENERLVAYIKSLRAEKNEVSPQSSFLNPKENALVAMYPYLQGVLNPFDVVRISVPQSIGQPVLFIVSKRALITISPFYRRHFSDQRWHTAIGETPTFYWQERHKKLKSGHIEPHYYHLQAASHVIFFACKEVNDIAPSHYLPLNRLKITYLREGILEIVKDVLKICRRYEIKGLQEECKDWLRDSIIENIDHQLHTDNNYQEAASYFMAIYRLPAKLQIDAAWLESFSNQSSFLTLQFLAQLAQFDYSSFSIERAFKAKLDLKKCADTLIKNNFEKGLTTPHHFQFLFSCLEKIYPDFDFSTELRGLLINKINELDQEQTSPSIKSILEYCLSLRENCFEFNQTVRLDDLIHSFTNLDSNWKLSPACTYFNKGYISCLSKKWDQAFESLSRALEFAPCHSMALVSRGMCYFTQGQIEKALQDFVQAIEIDPKHLSILIKQSHYYIAQGQLNLAIRILKQVIDLCPTDQVSLKNLFHCYLLKGDLAYLQSTLPLYYSHPIARSPTFKSFSFVIPGLIKLTQVDSELALDHYKKIIRLLPDNAFALEGLKIYCQATDQMEIAISCYAAAIKKGEHYDRMYKSLLCSGLAECYKGSGIMLTCFIKALEFYPYNFSALVGMANHYQKNGEIDNAIKYFKRALQVNSKNAHAIKSLKECMQIKQKEASLEAKVNDKNSTPKREKTWP